MAEVSLDTLEKETHDTICTHECNTFSRQLSCVFSYKCSMLNEVKWLEKEVGELEAGVESKKMTYHHAELISYVITNKLKYEQDVNAHRALMKRDE